MLFKKYESYTYYTDIYKMAIRIYQVQTDEKLTITEMLV